MQRFIFWATESVECSLILDGVLLRVLFYMMMKNFRNGGIWTRDTKVKMQRFIFCATESADFFGILDGILLIPLIYMAKNFTDCGIWTRDSRINTQRLIHTDFTLCATESVDSLDRIWSRALFNMMKSNYHINTIVGCKPHNMRNISLCAEPQSFCKGLHSSLNIWANKCSYSFDYCNN